LALLSTMSVLEFILSDTYFSFLSYEKVNYCKIWNNIIKKCYIIW